MSKKLVKSTGVVAGMTMVSRILGFVRDVALAGFFGAGPAFDAFVIAFKIPNFFRRLFAEGAFSQAFVPILTEYKTQQSQADVSAFVGKVAGALLASLLVIVVLAEIGVPLLVVIFAPGFLHHPVRYELSKHLLYITFPYLLLISMAAFAGAVLNAWQRFAIPALSPVLLNVAMIAAAMFGVNYFHQPIYILACGVIMGGVLQCGLQWSALYRAGLFPKLRFDWRDAAVWRVLKKMVPALFGVSVAQLGLLIDGFFASFLPSGSISWLYYSDRLTFLPLGVIGVALATVSLPNLSRHYTTQSEQAYSATLDWSLRTLALVGVPAAVGLSCLSAPILATLLLHGKFTVQDVSMASMSLMAFSFGLPAFMLVKVLATAFYSRQNIHTPVKVAASALLVNVILNLVFIIPLHHTGLALATSLASFFNSLCLLRLLISQGLYQPQPGWRVFLTRCVVANLALGLTATGLAGDFSQWVIGSIGQRSLYLMFVIASSLLVYVGVLWLTGLRFQDVRWVGSE
ncbi:MAG: murein biosynthesis integral membrane protein MurJ [Coxiellaceae bacterium]|nr:murein biosynthesis integral membrane protein MurJ [Coxiellaceae bacterium]|tara:strand:+ start:534 stop:2078 length:1545 start_codon:yes stop_codon:yes gene_type:complete